jgi:hypothetical protein
LRDDPPSVMTGSSGTGRARRDDLGTMQGRHQPQRNRGRAPIVWKPAASYCCRRCWMRRSRYGAPAHENPHRTNEP